MDIGTRTREEWENEVKSVETNLGTTAAKLESGLTSLAVLRYWQQQTQSLLGDLENRDVMQGFHNNGRGGLVTPPSPWT